MTKCPSCGSVIKEGTPFCAQCGVKLSAASEVAATSLNTAPHDFRKYFFVPATISALAEPSNFRRLFARSLFIFGVLWGLFGLFLAIYQVIQSWAPAVGNLPAYIILLPILLLSLYMTTHAVLQRAKDLAALPADGNMATRIFAVLFRLAGEVGTVLLLQQGLVTAISAWAGYLKPAESMLSILKQTGIAYTPENAFVIGLISIVYGIVAALLWLAASYFASEWLSQRISVTTDVRTLAGHK